MFDINQLPIILELIGVIAFAITGALSAIEREMDIFGILVMALITAIGGGIIRDILINHFPVSLQTPIYFYMAFLGGLLAIPISHSKPRYITLLKIFDAIGLAVFSILGAQIGIHFQLNFLSILILGLLTGIGGGVLRDILANEVPLVFRKEIYALASLIGITVFWMLIHFHFPVQMAVALGVLVIICIRLASMYWNLNLPHLR